MSAKGAARRICAGDTVMDPSLSVLALWRGVAARGIYVPVGTDEADVLQRGAAGVLLGSREAGGVLVSSPALISSL